MEEKNIGTSVLGIKLRAWKFSPRTLYLSVLRFELLAISGILTLLELIVQVIPFPPFETFTKVTFYFTQMQCSHHLFSNSTSQSSLNMDGALLPPSNKQ